MPGMTKKAQEPQESDDSKVVRYVGTSDIRQITSRDWAVAGVIDAPTVTWSRANDFRVDRKDLEFLSADAFRDSIEADPDFRVEDAPSDSDSPEE